MNAPEYIQNAAEFTSIWWTFPTIIIGAVVVLHWLPKVYKKISQRKEMVSHDWLILGVAVGFMGGVADNLWWGIAWTFDYVDSPYRDWWFRHGVYSNVIFRQLAGLYAGFCHMVAFYGNDKRKSIGWIKTSMMLGLAYALFLTLFLNH